MADEPPTHKLEMITDPGLHTRIACGAKVADVGLWNCTWDWGKTTCLQCKSLEPLTEAES